MIYNLGDQSILFKNISIQLQNDFDSSLIVSDIYSLDLAKCIYRYLDTVYNSLVFNSNQERLIDIRSNKVCDIYLSFVKLYKDITLNPQDTPLIDHIYDRNTSRVNYEYQTGIETINEITKYNVALWPISDEILQYVVKDSVITPLSSLEDIATMQKLLSNIKSFSYSYNAGLWDLTFSTACYTIQHIMHESDENIILSGLCDLHVEKYLRAHNDIRSTSYNV